MSILETFGFKPVTVDEVYPLVLDLVQNTKRVQMVIDGKTKRLKYFQSLTNKHFVVREWQVYDD